jgi:hypothetical protein
MASENRFALLCHPPLADDKEGNTKGHHSKFNHSFNFFNQEKSWQRTSGLRET